MKGRSRLLQGILDESTVVNWYAGVYVAKSSGPRHAGFVQGRMWNLVSRICRLGIFTLGVGFRHMWGKPYTPRPKLSKL